MDEIAMEVMVYLLVAVAFSAVGYAFGHKDGYREGYVHGLLEAANICQRYREAIHEMLDEEGGDD